MRVIRALLALGVAASSKTIIYQRSCEDESCTEGCIQFKNITAGECSQNEQGLWVIGTCTESDHGLQIKEIVYSDAKCTNAAGGSYLHQGCDGPDLNGYYHFNGCIEEGKKPSNTKAERKKPHAHVHSVVMKSVVVGAVAAAGGNFTQYVCDGGNALNECETGTGCSTTTHAQGACLTSGGGKNSLVVTCNKTPLGEQVHFEIYDQSTNCTGRTNPFDEAADFCFQSGGGSSFIKYECTDAH